MIKKIIVIVLVMCLITSCAIPDISTPDESADPPANQTPKSTQDSEQTTYKFGYLMPPAFLDADTIVYCLLSKAYPSTVKVVICDVKTGNVVGEKILPIDKKDMYIDVSGEIIILNKSTGVLNYYNSELINTKTVTLKNKNIYIESPYGDNYISPDKGSISYTLEEENKVITEDLTNNEILSSEEKVTGDINAYHLYRLPIPLSKNFCLQITREFELTRLQKETTQIINFSTKKSELEYNERISFRRIKGAIFLGTIDNDYYTTAFSPYGEYTHPIGPNFSDCVLLRPTQAGDVDIEFIQAPVGFEKSNIIVGENSEFILYAIAPDENYETAYSGTSAFALRDPDGEISYFDLPDNTDKKEFYVFVYHDFNYLTLSPTGFQLANDADDSTIKVYDFETGEFLEIGFN